MSEQFATLVGQFSRRLLASEEEQDSNAVGLGLGAVLAVVGLPGVLTSFFILDKYSSLMQWMRQRRIDPIRVSVSDEYFFVVLSMTIIGLIVVLRWDRLLPDKRDYQNLAPLPIPARDVFLANLCSLLILGSLFALAVNVVPTVLFPLFVTMNGTHISAYLHLMLIHGTTVFSATLFSFFSIFAIVGLEMLVVPRRFFRPVSVLTRIALVILLLIEPFFGGNFRFLPPYWFTAGYREMVGIPKAGTVELARLGWIALFAAILVSLFAYASCYRRHFVRISESLDALTGTARFRLPQWCTRLIFRSDFEHAVIAFTMKTLLRSERHLLPLGAYVGLGLVLGAQILSHRQPNLAEFDLLIGFFLITGLRFIFDIPAVLSANWVFKTAENRSRPTPHQIALRIITCVVLLLQLPMLSPRAVGCFALLFLFTEALLFGFNKIPFTCSKEPNLRLLLVRILAALFAAFELVPRAADFVDWSVGSPIHSAIFAAIVAAAWLTLRHYRGDNAQVVFEDRLRPAFDVLRLTNSA